MRKKVGLLLLLAAASNWPDGWISLALQLAAAGGVLWCFTER